MILVWLRSALQNRFDQLEHIAPEIAIELDLTIEQQTELLSIHPLLGAKGNVPGTRELTIGTSPYILVYRIRGSAVEILQVLHRAQRWPPRSVSVQSSLWRERRVKFDA